MKAWDAKKKSPPLLFRAETAEYTLRKEKAGNVTSKFSDHDKIISEFSFFQKKNVERKFFFLFKLVTQIS